MDKNIIECIQKYIISSKEEYEMSAYSLKYLFEHLLHQYISVEEFQESMIMAGFTPIPHPDFNHHYFIAVKESPEIPKEYWGKGYLLMQD